MISEVAFDSEPCRCNMTPETPPPMPTESLGESQVIPVVPAHGGSSGLLVGGLVTLGVVFGVVPVALCVLYYRMRLTKKASKTSLSGEGGLDTRKVSMKMKDLHINSELIAALERLLARQGQPVRPRGHGRGGGGHVPGAVQGAAAQPRLPHAGSLRRLLQVLQAARRRRLRGLRHPRHERDAAAALLRRLLAAAHPALAPARVARPRPVAGARPPRAAHAAIPPPPQQHYFTASQVCQAGNIQGVTGGVAFAATDTADLAEDQAVPEVPRHCLTVLETLGEGCFGTVQLCEMRTTPRSKSKALVVKSLNVDADDDARELFLQEARVLSLINDPNVVRLVGTVTRAGALGVLVEYLEHGDLAQFLQRHNPEASVAPVRRAPIYEGLDPPVLSYGALVYIASQVASGMKHLEKLNLVHRDLSARNCLVGRGLTVKVSDFAMSQPRHHKDYYHLDEKRALLPIRWMAWEAILQGRFSSKSDVWAFGVTLWEILTMARQQPFDELSDDGVLENVSHCYHGDGSGMMLLPQPPLCPREMFDMMAACWRPNPRQRPPFWEVLMFLQRKNLGYTLDYVD
ncbi:discoidin domain-containing receptor 2-like [Penaeus chinensis]|uniref:discoidin domain-containing receptor 2-like n=1 Tax=Penaeus chinensis TaxID=139456 RepID=UPI001FB7B0FB|nr:discoidin domain-containing receptor 2-like [Penaeus chinensis]